MAATIHIGVIIALIVDEDRVEPVFLANQPEFFYRALPDELAACSEYLERQINALNPKVIVTLGRYSMAHFLPNARISEVHGQAMKIKGRLIAAMYHPAAALHQQSLRSTIEADFARLPELIAQAEQMPEQIEEMPVEKQERKQLSFF